MNDMLAWHVGAGHEQQSENEILERNTTSTERLVDWLITDRLSMTPPLNMRSMSSSYSGASRGVAMSSYIALGSGSTASDGYLAVLNTVVAFEALVERIALTLACAEVMRVLSEPSRVAPSSTRFSMCENT